MGWDDMLENKDLERSSDSVRTGSASDAVARIGAAMVQMRLMIGRRYIGRLAIARVGAGMELSDLDVLGLVNRLGRSQEITVGTIADGMRIDHSRASRIVADLVKRGWLRRDVSQEDARRTLVLLSEEGAKVISRVEEVKHEVLSTVLSDWTAEDIEAFATLYMRFTMKMNEQANAFDAENAAK